MAEMMALLMFLSAMALLLSGYPVAFVLAGVALIFALLGSAMDIFQLSYIHALPYRVYGIMTSDLLIAVPLFVYMGAMLERAKIAEELLETMAALFGSMRSGLGISVMVVGAMLAASTGIVGATVVTMGLISLPTMLRNGYSQSISTGAICAAGTLGQVIPPSIVLILLGDQISSAWQTAQMEMQNPSPEPVSIADLFVGAIVPGLGLVALYILWLIIYGLINPKKAPALPQEERDRIFGHESFGHVLKVLLPPFLLIFIVLGSILAGLATATESAAVGAVGAMVLSAGRKQLTLANLREVMRSTARVSSMVFTILIGAAMFTLVFRGYGGDDIVHEFLSDLPGGLFMAMALTMLVMFFLGFFLDFIEIIFVVVPIVAPVLLLMGADPLWLAILMAVNLQTSFLTPPFGFALFYLRGVAPAEVKTTKIYKGVIPFIGIQLIMITLIAVFPAMATWLPQEIYGSEFILENPPPVIETPMEEQGDFEIDF